MDFRTRNRSSSGVSSHQQQREESSSQLGPKESSEPSDDMWAPSSLSHRELPVDVPDTLLQQAYPNKVMPPQTHHLHHLKKPKPTITPVANPRVPETATLVVAQSAEPQSTPGRPLSASDITLDFRQNQTTTIIVEDFYGIGSMANPFKLSDEDLSGHKESSVDADEDYPFAKEDYPTMLKSCSDDSASPRSSSGRSDSTVPLDSSLVLRSSDLSKENMITKVAQVFGTTSFDNPAYGLADFQELRNVVSTEMLISEPKVLNNNVVAEKTLTGKKKKRSKESLLRTGSTDELLGVEMSSMPRIRKKKQHFSSGYSTLRSNTSSNTEDQVDFLVASKKFREVAVDCPADFVPVTKSHPVYPPPCKSNTLDTKRVAKEKQNNVTNMNMNNMNNNNNLGEPLDLVEKKVRSRSKIRSLLINSFMPAPAPPPALVAFATLDDFTLQHHHNQKHRLCTTDPLPSSTKKAQTCTTAPALTSKSRENLIDQDDEDEHAYSFIPAYDNPCLDVDVPAPDDDLYPDCKFKTFLGDDDDDEEEFQKPAAHVENDEDRAQFVQEKNQNSRNSLRVRVTPKKCALEVSPNTQNLNNSRLSMAYRNSKRFEVVKNLEASRFLCKSELDLSNASMFANWSGLKQLQNSVSDTQLQSGKPTEVIELTVIEPETNDIDDTTTKVEGEGTKEVTQVDEEPEEKVNTTAACLRRLTCIWLG